MSTVSKTLSLQRAYFPDGFNDTLEGILKGLFSRKKTPSERVVQLDLVTNILFASLTEGSPDGGVFLRVLKFETGAIGVINLNTQDAEAVVEDFLHPTNHSFLKDQMTIYVNGDNVVACNIKNSAPTIVNAICQAVSDDGVTGGRFSFRVADIPDRRELEQIRRHGVKKVDFKISSYIANLTPFVAKDPARRNLIHSIFAAPDDSDTIRKRANAVGSITLSRGKFEADEQQKDEWLTRVGQDVINDECVESFTIELENGAKISNEKLKKSRVVKLPRRANSYSSSHAEQELKRYYSDLKKDGSLDG